MDQQRELISQAEFGRRLERDRGAEYTRAAVSKWVREGRIPSEHGKIPYLDALEAFDKHVVPKTDSGAVEVRDPAVDPDTQAQPTIKMAEAKLRHQALQTAKAQLDYDVARGKLLDRDAVLSENFAAWRLLRDQLRALPAKHAARLAHMTDPIKIRKLLEAEIETMLDGLYKRIAETPDTVRSEQAEALELGL